MGEYFNTKTELLKNYRKLVSKIITIYNNIALVSYDVFLRPCLVGSHGRIAELILTQYIIVARYNPVLDMCNLQKARS